MVDDNEFLTIHDLRAKRTQYRCTRATRQAFMPHDAAISRVPRGADVMRCYTVMFHAIKDITIGSLSIDEYEPHAREVLLMTLHGFCLRTGSAQPAKKQWPTVPVKGHVELEFGVSEAATDEDRALNDTADDTRRVNGHRYRFFYYANSEEIHKAAQDAFNARAKKPRGTAVTFTVEESVMRWDPHDEALRLAVADAAELFKKIHTTQAKATNTANETSGSVARRKEVYDLSSYGWIKHTRIDQFYANAIIG